MLISTDLDQTLLNNKSQVSEYTKDILDKAKAKGHIIAYNTARHLAGVMDVYEQYVPDYLILNGGCAIYDSKLNPIYEARVSLEDTKRLIKILQDNKCGILLEIGDGFLTDLEEVHQRFTNSKVADLSKIDKGALKLVYYSEDHTLLDKLQNEFPHLDMVNYLGKKLYKISLRILLPLALLYFEILGNEIKVASFGDDYGDIEMLEESDIAVCMKNSQEKLFSYNFNVTEFDNDNDGVSKWIENNILLD